LAKLFPNAAREISEEAGAAQYGIAVDISALKAKQTNPQRGYYHMWKRAFAGFCGTTPDEMHEHLLCEAYGSEYTRTRLGLMKRPLQRSSKANRTEYSVLIETLIRVAAEMGFVVPPPHRMDDSSYV
jgi:hypothetical protein